MRAWVSLSGSFLVVFLLMVTVVWAVPNTINYQGVLTDSTGTPLSGEVSIIFRLFDAESAGTELWNETQTVSVTGGTYSVQLGEVTPLGTLDFSAPYWLEIEVEGETLSPRQVLTSVPYAMRAQYADGVASGTNFSLTGQWLSGDGDDEGLFVNDAGKVGVGVAPTTADFEVAGENGVLFGGAYGQGSIPAEGEGTRMMWYPGRAAFRAGRLDSLRSTNWDDSNVGNYSVAMGTNNIASGSGAVAMGEFTLASGAQSFAMGWNSQATSQGSFSTGQFSHASGVGAVAMGLASAANGVASFAAGSSFAEGDYSNAIGHNAYARSFSETAIGSYNTYLTPTSFTDWEPTDRLFVIGNGTANDARSDALVMLKNGDTTINGNLDISGTINGELRVDNIDGVLFSGQMFSGSIPVEGSGLRMMWYPRKAAFRSGYTSYTQWDDVNIGNYSVAVGYSPEARGDSSVALGLASGAYGDGSVALGRVTHAESLGEVALGSYNTTRPILNTSEWDPNDRLFTIGNGTAGDARSDAMVVLKNGNTGIGTVGTNAPAARLHIANPVIDNTPGKHTLYLTESNNLESTTTGFDPTKPYYGIGFRRAWNTNNMSNIKNIAGIYAYGVQGYRGGLVFKTENSVDSEENPDVIAMVIRPDGNVGIGTSAPDSETRLNVVSDAATEGTASAILAETTGATDYSSDDKHYGVEAVAGGAYSNIAYYGTATDSNGNLNIGLRAEASGGEVNTGVYGEASGGTWTYGVYGRAPILTGSYAGYFDGDLVYTGASWDVSDRRLKENIKPLEQALDKLDNINGVYFNMKKTPDITEVGVIAQDVQAVLPEAVGVIDREGHLGVSYDSLVPLLIEAVKELKVQSENIQAQNLQLQRRNSALQALICLDHPTATICQ